MTTWKQHLLKPKIGDKIRIIKQINMHWMGFDSLIGKVCHIVDMYKRASTLRYKVDIDTYSIEFIEGEFEVI